MMSVLPPQRASCCKSSPVTTLNNNNVNVSNVVFAVPHIKPCLTTSPPPPLTTAPLHPTDPDRLKTVRSYNTLESLLLNNCLFDPFVKRLALSHRIVTPVLSPTGSTTYAPDTHKATGRWGGRRRGLRIKPDFTGVLMSVSESRATRRAETGNERRARLIIVVNPTIESLNVTPQCDTHRLCSGTMRTQRCGIDSEAQIGNSNVGRFGVRERPH
ncbi:hypothetical protein J6590_009118 [Homalodisca vitripennis]|nr:hypothetical protein J6590_009118 [Homalodisca vitripennis]